MRVGEMDRNLNIPTKTMTWTCWVVCGMKCNALMTCRSRSKLASPFCDLLHLRIPTQLWHFCRESTSPGASQKRILTWWWILASSKLHQMFETIPLQFPPLAKQRFGNMLVIFWLECWKDIQIPTFLATVLPLVLARRVANGNMPWHCWRRWQGQA